MANLAASSRFQRSRGTQGFSLVELLCVLAIVSILTATVVPAFNGMNSAGNVTKASTAISSALQRARSYAISHNTYVWVGFYEEAADASAPTNVAPPYTGKGRVVIGIAASVDGTASPSGGSGFPSLNPIEKILKVSNVHLTDIGAPAAPTPMGETVDTRPNGAYTTPTGGGASTLTYGINSDDSNGLASPLTVGSYSFYKVIRFSPSGEATINGDTSLRRISEIGIRPTHGDTLDTHTPNVAAVQFTGIGGDVQIYRK